MVVPPSAGGGMSSMAGTITTMRVNPQSTSHAVGGVRGKMRPMTPALAANAASQPNNSNPVIPLSARKAQALDLNTVERRGGPLAPRESGKKTSRPHNLEEALTFKPSEEEWKNPIEYIQKIGPEARKYGICKIIPPDGWNPDFAIDTEVRLSLKPVRSGFWAAYSPHVPNHHHGPHYG
jgi:[histone H3]-trimethyl-L-lysine4 demethylase